MRAFSFRLKKKKSAKALYNRCKNNVHSIAMMNT